MIGGGGGPKIIFFDLHMMMAPQKKLQKSQIFYDLACQLQSSSCLTKNNNIDFSYCNINIRTSFLLLVHAKSVLVTVSVVAALSWHFAILVNKICRIMNIFEQLDNLRNRWVLCQH